MVSVSPLPTLLRPFRRRESGEPFQPAPKPVAAAEQTAADRRPGLRFYLYLTAGLLLAAVVVSGMSVIYVKHQSRSLFIDLQHLQRQRDALDIQWAQLQLEQSTLATESEVDRTARTRLDMITPPYDSVVYLRR